MNLTQKLSLLILLLALAINSGHGVTSYGQVEIEKAQKASESLVLRVIVIFDPPTEQLFPPQNIRLDVTCMNMTRITDMDANSPALFGYKIYRVRLDLPFPNAEDIVKDSNLVGSIPASSTVFVDQVPISTCEDKFCYVLTSFFENGTQSSPSQIVCIGSGPATTDPPVIKNPNFRKGSIFIDAAGSFIQTGAVLVVNDKESYLLQQDQTGAFLTVPKGTPGTPSGLDLMKVIKRGCAVRLVVKNPNGKLSDPVWFTRK